MQHLASENRGKYLWTMLGLWLFSYKATVLPLNIRESLDPRSAIKSWCSSFTVSLLTLEVINIKQCKLFYYQLLLLYYFSLQPEVKIWAHVCANHHNSCDGSVSFFSFYLFTIFMRAAKGPFHATIWEQPLTAGDGPMGTSRLSLVVVGMRAGWSITAGLAA